MLCFTMICQDDDVEAAVHANLLQAIHELTNDLIHTLDCLNQLQGTDKRNKTRHIQHVATVLVKHCDNHHHITEITHTHTHTKTSCC